MELTEHRSIVQKGALHLGEFRARTGDRRPLVSTRRFLHRINFGQQTLLLLAVPRICADIAIGREHSIARSFLVIEVLVIPSTSAIAIGKKKNYSDKEEHSDN